MYDAAKLVPFFGIALIFGAVAAFQAPEIAVHDAQASVALVLVKDKKDLKTYTEEEEDAYQTYKKILEKDPDNEALKEKGITKDYID